jgi:hypothetical protein
MIATLLGWGKAALGFASTGKFLLIAGGIVFALVAYLWVEGELLAEQRDKARREAADSKIVLSAMLADHALQTSIVAARDAKISELEGKTRDLIEKIRAVPITKACSSSPAVRTLLDGLRDGAGQTR